MKRRTSLCAAAFAATSLSALAQAPDNGSDEAIEVVATRQAYRGVFERLETPASVTTLDEEILQRAGALDLSQALDLSASVSRQNNFGGLWNSFAIRGLVGDENLPSGYLVNGFNAGRGFGGPRDLSGVERIEILKGPKAALFGRGEPGGAVNLVTKRPTFDRAATLRLSAGRFDFWRADVDGTTPLNDALAVRVVGFFEDAESFRDTIETQRYGASPSVTLRLGEATTVTYELEASHQEVPFDRGVPAIGGRLGVIPDERFLGEPGDGPIETDVLGHQVELQHDFNERWSVLIGGGYRDTSLAGFSSEAELARNRQRLFVDGRTLSRQRRSREYDSVYSVVRGEVAGSFDTGPIEHRVLVGADADRFENDQLFKRYRGPTLATNPSLQRAHAIDVFAPVYGRFPLPVVTPLTDRLEVQEAVGVYLQDQFSLGSRVQLRVGVRHDDFEQDINDRIARRRTRQSENRWSPQTGLVFAATDLVSLYVAYGEGFRALTGADFAGNPFAPNVSDSLEGGLQFDLPAQRLAGTIAIFSLSQDNNLTSDPLNPGFSITAGEARSRGVELDLNGEPLPGLTVWLSYAFIDAEAVNDVLDVNFGQSIEAGDRLLNVPRHTVNLQVAKALDVNHRRLNVGGGLLHVGTRLGEVATDFELPAYTVLRSFADYQVTNHVLVRAEIDNLLDESFYTNSFSQLWVQPGPPVSFRLSTILTF